MFILSSVSTLRDKKNKRVGRLRLAQWPISQTDHWNVSQPGLLIRENKCVNPSGSLVRFHTLWIVDHKNSTYTELSGAKPQSLKTVLYTEGLEATLFIFTLLTI